MSDDTERPLVAGDLVPTGGSWSGLLFDNPAIGLPAQLTWTFNFNFTEVDLGYGPSAANMTVDWVPLPGANWRSLAGRTVSAAVFAEPVETSIYFFAHHRYDEAHLEVLAQRGPDLEVEATVKGDVDGLGLETVDVRAALAFEGIRVHLSDTPASPAEAASRLAEFTDISGLVATGDRGRFLFAPAAERERR